jgi:hypothetical protein
MLSPWLEAGVRRSLAGASSLSLSGAAGGGEASVFACGSPPDGTASASGGLAGTTICSDGAGFLAPVTAIPLLLNPTTSTGIGTKEVRVSASSVRP